MEDVTCTGLCFMYIPLVRHDSRLILIFSMSTDTLYSGSSIKSGHPWDIRGCPD